MKIVNCKLKIAKHSGFTLIEILVAMAIVGVIAGITFVNVGKNDDQGARLEADRVMTFIREAQNSALAGDYVSVGAGEKICGFGVYYVSDSKLGTYYIKTSGATAQDDSCPALRTHAEGIDIGDRQLSLGNGVVINSPSDFDVFFEIPSGKAYLNGEGECAAATLPYPVALEKGNSSVDVDVECTGRIYIE
ncbi:MAG: type II secretion system protein [Parcubacteria group bacterium]|jgi:prepilin-type N-terminal cleavage/methylation domain-containing protein